MMKFTGNAFYNLPSCIKWVNEFYHLWSGRITLTILDNIFYNLPLVMFNIANSIAFIIILLEIYKIISIIQNNKDLKDKSITLIIIFSLVMFINVKVLEDGCYWMSGALNYLWPIAAMLIAIIPFIAQLNDIKIRKTYYILAFISNILAGFAEQTACILIFFGIITIIWCKLEKKRIDKLLIIHYIIILCFSATNLLAPGNQRRYISEEINWYSSYSMLRLSDKLVQGYIYTFKNIIKGSNILFSIITIISSILVLENNKKKNKYKYIVFIPVIYVLLSNMNFLFNQNVVLKKIYNYVFVLELFNENTLYTKKALIQLISSSAILSIVLCQILYAFKDIKQGLITAILYCASICSALMLSFSPTIYASSYRIFTVMNFLMVLVASLLIEEFRLNVRNKPKGKKVMNLLTVTIVVLAIASYMNIIFS